MKTAQPQQQQQPQQLQQQPPPQQQQGLFGGSQPQVFCFLAAGFLADILQDFFFPVTFTNSCVCV